MVFVLGMLGSHGKIMSRGEVKGQLWSPMTDELGRLGG